MFVIPMAGLSSRFFQAGFSAPKYMLQVHGKSVLQRALESFEDYFASDLFVLIIRDVYGTHDFVRQTLQKLSIAHCKIVVLQNETQGQADTVYKGLKTLDSDEEIFIFNIDTFRYGFKKPDWACAGYLEVFEGQGEHWSFIQADATGRVTKTTEKERISNLCSDGLYYFDSAKTFMDLFETAQRQHQQTKGEYYIAPLYNQLIAQGRDIRYVMIAPNEIDFCGTPEEYARLCENGCQS